MTLTDLARNLGRRAVERRFCSMQDRTECVPATHRALSLLIALLLLFSGSYWATAAQTGVSESSSDRLQRLEESVSRLELRISELTSLLKAVLPPAPVVELAPTSVGVIDGPVRGSIGARLVLIEYSDFECPFCGRHAASAYREIQARFVDTGKVRYAFRHLPIEQLHPHAKKAAEAAECAGKQGKFWEFHDRLFANQKALTVADLTNHARSLALTIPVFESCLSEGRMASRIEADLAKAQKLGLTGTPVFMIGKIHEDGSVRVTRKIVGAHPFPVYEAVLSELLGQSADAR